MKFTELKQYFTLNEKDELTDLEQKSRLSKLIPSTPPLIFCLENYYQLNLKLSQKQWDYLIKNSNLNLISETIIIKYLPLNSYFLNKKNIKLKSSLENYLIKSTNLNLNNDDIKFSLPIESALQANCLLTEKQWIYLIKNTFDNKNILHSYFNVSKLELCFKLEKLLYDKFNKNFLLWPWNKNEKYKKFLLKLNAFNEKKILQKIINNNIIQNQYKFKI